VDAVDGVDVLRGRGLRDHMHDHVRAAPVATLGLLIAVADRRIAARPR
jgi:hypothetical protein